MCATLTFYTIYSYKTEKKIAKENVLEDTETVTKQAAWFGFIKAIAGIALTVGGAKLLVASASDLAANIWHVDNKIIGLTVVAVGTSLPELATSVVASLKKQSDVALGNVIGSNIYNALFILGLTAVFVPIQVPEAMLIDMMVMVMATLALLWIGFCRKYVARWMGLLFVIVYFVYVVFLGVSQ